MDHVSEKLLIVIPTYNEDHNVTKLIQKIRKYVNNCGLIIVDDNSPDGTADSVKQAQKQDKNIYLLKRERKMGYATAYIEGFRWGLRNGYEYLGGMDADLSHDPKYLKTFIEKINKYDFLIGSRNIEGGNTLNWPRRRKILSKLGNLYSRFILSVPISDLTSGFNMWREQVLKDIDLNSIRSEGYSFNIELKYRAYKKGFSYGEIPITFRDRMGSRSKFSYKIIFEAFWKVLLFRLR